MPHNALAVASRIVPPLNTKVTQGSSMAFRLIFVNNGKRRSSSRPVR